MRIDYFEVKKDDKCCCCGKKKKDIKLYCEDLVNGTYCGKCYEKLLIVENIKKDISEVGDLMTVSPSDIVDLTVEKLGYMYDK